MFKQAIYFITFFCFISCTSNNEKETESKQTTVINIDPTKGKSTLVSELFSETKFIKFETKDTCLIDDVVKVRYVDNRWYVEANSSLLVFDDKGKFIFEIDKRGKGPDQYMELTDTWIDAENNQIELLDGRTRKIMYFDLQGNYQNYWKHDIISIAFTKLDNATYAFYCGNIGNGDLNKKIIIKTKNSDKVSASFLDINFNQAKYMHFMDMVNFGKIGQEHTFSNSSENIIYKVGKNDLSPKFTLDFGKYNTPKDFLDQPYENVVEYLQEIKKRDYVFLIDPFYELNKHIFFGFNFGEDTFLTFYSRQTNTYKVVSKIEDDMNFSGISQIIGYENKPRGGSNDELYYVIESEVFISQVKQVKKQMSEEDWKEYSEKHPQIIEIFNTIKPGDNPVLMIAKLK